MNYLNQYDKNYYDNFLVEGKPVEYTSSPRLIEIYNEMATKLIENFSPKTVLDIGCASGHLIYFLREKGIDAYGMDVSKYAIEHVNKKVRSFCKCFSIIDGIPREFPDKFDLIISIEMIEHLYEEDCEKAIEVMCSHSEKIIISSSSNDFLDRTHLNVQQPEYWTKRFAKHGFYNRIDERPAYVLEGAMFFEKTKNIARVTEDYERNLRIVSKNLEQKIKDFDYLMCDRQKAQEIMDNQALQVENLVSDFDILKEDRRKAQEVLDSQKEELIRLRSDFEVLKEDRRKAQEILDNQKEELIRLSVDFETLKEDRRKAQDIIEIQKKKLDNIEKRWWGKFILR